MCHGNNIWFLRTCCFPDFKIHSKECSTRIRIHRPTVSRRFIQVFKKYFKWWRKSNLNILIFQQNILENHSDVWMIYITYLLVKKKEKEKSNMSFLFSIFISKHFIITNIFLYSCWVADHKFKFGLSQTYSLKNLTYIYLNVYKKMTVNLLLLHSKTWNDLTLCK